MSDAVSELRCSKCGLELAIDLAAAPVRLQYDHETWCRACAHPDADGPATCPEMTDLIRKLIERRGGNGPLGN